MPVKKKTSKPQKKEYFIIYGNATIDKVQAHNTAEAKAIAARRMKVTASPKWGFGK